MSANLVPPQVFVDTPRPHNQGENNNATAGDYNGLISISLSNFVASSKGGKSPTRKSPSPRISPRGSPRPKKKG